MRWRPLRSVGAELPSVDFPFPFFVMRLTLGEALELSMVFVGKGSSWERPASAAATRTSPDVSEIELEEGGASITQSEELENDFVWWMFVLSHFRREF
jgi:hypothetical protein